jgi:thiol-disulfide isomerase/thioredoxin
MFRPGRAPVVPPQAVQQAAQASPNPALASSLLQSVAAMATQSGSAPAPAAGTPASSTVSAPMQICSNAASFATLLRGHRVLVAFFTSTTCPPCRIVEPVFERLAEEKTAGRAGRDMPAFVKINIDAGPSSQLAGQYGVRATPTFLFFLDGNKVSATSPYVRYFHGSHWVFPDE